MDDERKDEDIGMDDVDPDTPPKTPFSYTFSPASPSLPEVEPEHGTGPWSKRTPLEAMGDLIGFLRCHIRPERQTYCTARLTDMIHLKQFNRFDRGISDQNRELFRRAVAATMNCSNAASTAPGTVTLLSHVDVSTLYELILPKGILLPCCVNHRGKRESWFVAADTEGRRYKSCLCVDEKLAQHVLASQALYSDAMVPFVDPTIRGGPLPNVRDKVDMMVWFVWFILNKSGRALPSPSDDTKMMMTKKDFNEVLDCLVRMVQEMSEQYAFLRTDSPLFNNPLFQDYY
jgi:hypothetical protein